MELPRLLELLATRQSSQARLKSDEPLQLWSGEGWTSANTPIPSGQLNRMLALAAPPEVRAFIHDLNARYEFDYPHPSGIYHVQVEAVQGKRTVFITRLDANGQPLRPRDDGSNALGLDGTFGFDLPAAGANAMNADAVTPRPQPENEWFYAHGGQSLGPHTFEQMVSLVKSGALPRETMVFSSRVGDWQQAKLSELGRLYTPENAGEWKNPAIENWQPPTQADLHSERILMRSLAGGGVALLFLLVGWVAIAQVRGANRARDYSVQMAQKAEDSSSSGAIHNVKLHRGEDDPMIYSGTGQYANGYLADVFVKVNERDFWSRPAQTEVKASPHDFAPELASLTRTRFNERLSEAESRFRVENVSLSHGAGNSYSGTIRFNDRTIYPMSAEITQFDTDGSLLRWTQKADIN